MNTFFLLLPAGLSALVLAAHFLRRGEMLSVLLCLGLIALLWVRRPWAARVIQGALVAGSLEWLRTLVEDMGLRRAAGEPWLRMAIILGAVIGVALGGALLLESRELRRRFGRIAE